MTSRSWCFTINNPDFPEEISEDGPLYALLQTIPKLRYCIYQLEQGESGTFHYQGYAEFTSPVRFSALNLGEFQRGHFEQRRGTRDQARDYCQKDEGQCDGPWEFGEWIGGQGSRSDLTTASTELLQHRNLSALARSYPATFVKFSGGFSRLLEATAEPVPVAEPTWRDWQMDAITLLSAAPDPRRIHWWIDQVGGTGKSFLVRYLASNKGALPLSSGRHDRLLNAWTGQSIVTFDFSRDVNSASGGSEQHGHDRTPYSVIESIKNGVVFSGFFGTGPRIFPIPHILCFSNFEPDQSKLSADRWDIRRIGDTL